MLSRRTFLQSALLLPAAFTHASSARAQEATPGTTPAQAKPATEVFADFEGGAYDGWTVEGDAFGSAPATDALFPGQIGGFVGRGFLCSLHPKKGNAATGKATSHEFTVEKPFITFKIGGGNHPNEACLNLVVDGQVVRTATGSDTPSLSDASWDVSALVGKKAHLEVVDSTTSNERGYILVDDITFAAVPTDNRLLTYESGPTLAQFGIGRTFFQQSTVRFTQPYGDREFGPVFDFGITPMVHKHLINAVCSRVYCFPHNPSRPIEETAKILRQVADEKLVKSGVANTSLFLRQWMYCESICAFVTANVSYDADIVEQTLGKGEALETERWRRQAVEIVYGMPKPSATCDGFTRLTIRLARLSGIKCYHLEGTMRADGHRATSTNHGWPLFELDGGVRVPADVTVPWGGRMNLWGLNEKIGWRTLPITVRAWEAFMALWYQNKIINENVSQSNPSLIRATFEEWLSCDYSQHERLAFWYDKIVTDSTSSRNIS